MPPITLRTPSRTPLWIGVLFTLVCAFTATAAAVSKQRVPLPAPIGTGTGLAAVYIDTGGSSVSRVDKKIDFTWGRGSPAPSFAADSFSARWTGEIEPRYSETYKLSTISDDGVRLWLNGQLVIDNWTEHSARDDAGLLPAAGGPSLCGEARVLRKDERCDHPPALVQSVASKASRAKESAVSDDVAAGASFEHCSIRVAHEPRSGHDLHGAGRRAARCLRV